MNEFGFKSPFFNKNETKTNDSTNKETLENDESSLKDIAAKILPVYLLNMLNHNKNTLNTNLLASVPPPILRLFDNFENNKDKVHQDCDGIVTHKCKNDTDENKCDSEKKCCENHKNKIHQDCEEIETNKCKNDTNENKCDHENRHCENKKNKIHHNYEVIMSNKFKGDTNENKCGSEDRDCENKKHQDCEEIITNKCKNDTDENKCDFEDRYYFDKSGFPIDECERHSIHCGCKNIIETCCLIEIPRGFRLAKCSPEMCFNLSELSCIKTPIVQKIDLPTLKCEYPKQCEVVSGYELRAVGEVNFSLSIPICPINGYCTPGHSHASCSGTVPVNEIISHTCCSKPCTCSKPCVDWTFAYYSTTPVKKDCFSYVRVKMGIALEYTGDCECDEE